jgi:hypothetical protein
MVIVHPVFYLKHDIHPVFYLKHDVSETKFCVFRLHLETESSLRNVIFYIKDRTMGNVEDCDSYVNISLS